MNTQRPTNQSDVSPIMGATFGAALGAIIGVTYSHTNIRCSVARHPYRSCHWSSDHLSAEDIPCAVCFCGGCNRSCCDA
jgi:hypothetical protein